MRLNVMLEPQTGLSYADQLTIAAEADTLGFEGLYRSDHYAQPDPAARAPSTDAWAALAGLARETERLRLGVLVTAATFRSVGNLVKVVTTVAEMAGSGRVDLGLGTGWMEEEHRQLGFPFEDLATRFRRLDEYLQVVRGLWDAGEEPFSFEGRFARLRDARLLPRPDPMPRIICGGSGMRRTPRLAARYADELNGIYLAPDDARRQRGALHAACEERGRDPDELTYSVMTGCAVGLTPDEVDRRLRRLHELTGGRGSFEAYRERVGAVWVVGTPEQAADGLGALAEAGVDRVMLQVLDPADTELLHVLAEAVAPLLPASRPDAPGRNNRP